MKRLLRFLIRGGLFLALLLGIDQAILHVSPDVPGIRTVRHFYVDFRDRLLHLGNGNDAASIEAAIETAERPSNKKPETTSPSAPSPRYVFAGEDGQLQFADSLEQIPPAYRQSAQILDD